MALHSHYDMFHYFGLTESVEPVTPSLPVIPSVAYYSTWSHRVEVIGPTELMFALTLAHRSHRVDHAGPTENPNVHIF